MSGRFCPSCGKTEGDFYHGFCIDCYMKQNVKISLPHQIEVLQCKKCGSWLSKGKNVSDNYQNLKKLLKPLIKTNLNKWDFKVDIDGEKATVSISGSLDKEGHFDVEREYGVNLLFKNTSCTRCNRISGKTFETKIQMRKYKENSDPELYDRMINFIKKEMEFMAKKTPEAEAFWVTDGKDGTDIFFGYKDVSEELMSRLKMKFDHAKATVTKSMKLMGMDSHTSKKRFQATYCIRV